MDKDLLSQRIPVKQNYVINITEDETVIEALTEQLYNILLEKGVVEAGNDYTFEQLLQLIPDNNSHILPQIREWLSDVVYRDLAHYTDATLEDIVGEKISAGEIIEDDTIIDQGYIYQNDSLWGIRTKLQHIYEVLNQAIPSDNSNIMGLTDVVNLIEEGTEENKQNYQDYCNLVGLEEVSSNDFKTKLQELIRKEQELSDFNLSSSPNWDSNKAYSINDIVKYENNYYVSLIDNNQSINPPSSLDVYNNWKVI